MRLRDLALRRGRRRMALDRLSRVDDAEAQARAATRIVGVPALRRDYTRRADGLVVWQRGARAPIG